MAVFYVLFILKKQINKFILIKKVFFLKWWKKKIVLLYYKQSLNIIINLIWNKIFNGINYNYLIILLRNFLYIRLEYYSIINNKLSTLTISF